MGISVLFILGCSSSLYVSASSAQRHLGRPKFFLAESAKSFYGRELCHAKDYHCIKIKMGDTWQKLFPDEKERQLVMRLNRTNVAVSLRSWILVPDNLSEITYHDVSPLPLKLNTKGKKLLLINLREHAFAAYDTQGNLVHWGPIPAGKGICADGKNCETVTGKFRIFRVHGENCKSGEISDRNERRCTHALLHVFLSRLGNPRFRLYRVIITVTDVSDFFMKTRNC